MRVINNLLPCEVDRVTESVSVLLVSLRQTAQRGFGYVATVVAPCTTLIPEVEKARPHGIILFSYYDTSDYCGAANM